MISSYTEQVKDIMNLKKILNLNLKINNEKNIKCDSKKRKQQNFTIVCKKVKVMYLE